MTSREMRSALGLVLGTLLWTTGWAPTAVTPDVHVGQHLRPLPPEWQIRYSLDCDAPTLPACAFYGDIQQSGIYTLDGTRPTSGAGGSGEVRLAFLTPPRIPGLSLGQWQASMRISRWDVAAADPGAGVVPSVPDFFVYGRMRVQGTGVSRPELLPIGSSAAPPFTDVRGDTAVPVQPGSTRVTTLYSPWSCSTEAAFVAAVTAISTGGGSGDNCPPLPVPEGVDIAYHIRQLPRPRLFQSRSGTTGGSARPGPATPASRLASPGDAQRRKIPVALQLATRTGR